MALNEREEMGSKNHSGWKRYVYKLIGSEISTTTRFCDESIQVEPLDHDSGLLFDSINCSSKNRVMNRNKLPHQAQDKNTRSAIVLNGNLNYSTDIQELLNDLRQNLSRHSRLFVVMYNPFLGWLYSLATLLNIRVAPKPKVYLTEKNIQALARLTNYDVVRIRPSVFIPFYVPIISNFFNKLLPVIPLVRRLSLVWVLVLRPIKKETKKPSLSIIIPARNESGNIADAIDRIPKIDGAELEVIFVEGNSTDDTWQKIQDEVNAQRADFVIKSFKQPGKGKNDAVRVGFENATKELVTILDADLTMPPEMLPRFYDAYCDGVGDFVNGSRLVYPMEDEAMRPLNRLGNIFFCKLLAWFLNLPITDSLCGTKLYTRQDYNRMVQWRHRFGDFDPFGDFEMLFSASELTLGVVDIPVQYRARTYGETNISRFRHGLELARMSVIGFFRILLGKVK